MTKAQLEKQLDNIFSNKDEVLAILQKILKGELNKKVYFYGTNGKTAFKNLIEKTFPDMCEDIINGSKILSSRCRFAFLHEGEYQLDDYYIKQLIDKKITPIILSNTEPVDENSIIIYFNSIINKSYTPYKYENVSNIFATMIQI
jgi:hypothetical protein